ncbi:hypothetical protein [Idiomarina xiamenensis]|uniref:TPR repeat-containing SEL1 subfamily protein n=1 Tax=Idiomarina xiamenensis 10-D-4 TaxID=740709 RepID=K2KFU1_9GAMM|nr:hypothetical protein [Idiomarina xiamenensis]EKE86878.1 TPR repeat-containing SEL1 subfamily protein [Idiomarina xiamenensis 10-D-4]
MHNNSDATSATEHWRKQAAKHFIEASRLMQHGESFQAAKHFRQAALLGHARAMLYLGKLFIKGQVLPHSYFHAWSWLQLATLAGDKDAPQLLQQLQPHLTAADINRASALAATRFEDICDMTFKTPEQNSS